MSSVPLPKMEAKGAAILENRSFDKTLSVGPISIISAEQMLDGVSEAKRMEKIWKNQVELPSHYR
jgi:hypothetical protein